MAFPLPDKPSIAVLPFANRSGDATQDFLGDGITENIVTLLSRVAGMFVIAWPSTLNYKGKPVKMRQVAEDLGVRYVLEGGVQWSDDQVLITVQFVDALTGRHLWAGRYDRQADDAFALQDDITLNILAALEAKLTGEERARLRRGNTKNLEAYLILQRGFRHFLRLTKEDNAEAQRLFKNVIKLDPKYALAWHSLGLTHQQSAKFGWGEDSAKENARAEELARKALVVNPSIARPYDLLANLSLQRRRYDEAVAYSEKAVALAPNSSALVAHLGRTLVYAGRPEEALPLIQRGIRLSPITPPEISRFEGQAYHAMARYDEAIAAFERARARNPKGVLPLVLLAMTYADMGRMEKARAAAREILGLGRGFSATGFVNGLDYKDRAKSKHALAALRGLGFSE